MEARYELAAEQCFWEIVQQGRALMTRWGTLQGDEQVLRRSYPSEAAARAARDLLVAERIAEGWRRSRVA